MRIRFDTVVAEAGVLDRVYLGLPQIGLSIEVDRWSGSGGWDELDPVDVLWVFVGIQAG